MKGAGVERFCHRGIPHHGIPALWDPPGPRLGLGEMEGSELTHRHPPHPPVFLATPRALQLPT